MCIKNNKNLLFFKKLQKFVIIRNLELCWLLKICKKLVNLISYAIILLDQH